jgi:L-aspartate oxidase
MGGVQTDRYGRTSIGGLWACGEVATTGVHGANRLASNSLLEALTYALRVAADVQNDSASRCGHFLRSSMIPETPPATARNKLQTIEDATRKLMSQKVGILRSGIELQEACSELSDLEAQLTVMSKHHATDSGPANKLVRTYGEIRNRLLVARLITLAALRREESRGAHYRDDFPTAKLDWQHRQAMTVEALLEAH